MGLEKFVAEMVREKRVSPLGTVLLSRSRGDLLIRLGTLAYYVIRLFAELTHWPKGCHWGVGLKFSESTVYFFRELMSFHC